MPLAIITPTRRRWPAIEEQAIRLAPQLDADDRWIVVVDGDLTPSGGLRRRCEARVGAERMIWCWLHYRRPDPPAARVNHARNVGAALAPPNADLVELDDHDPIESDALAELRAALAAGADYAFGGYKQRASLPVDGGRSLSEAWPDVLRNYSPGGFARGDLGADALGLRAIRRTWWDKLGGWRLDVWPCADQDFALRAERAGANIVCLPRPLCTVTVEAESLSANFRGRNPAAESPR